MPARMVSADPFERPLGPQREVDGGQEEERVQPPVGGAEDDDRPRDPPKYFSGHGDADEQDQQDADDVRHHPVPLQCRGDRLLRVTGRRRPVSGHGGRSADRARAR